MALPRKAIDYSVFTSFSQIHIFRNKMFREPLNNLTYLLRHSETFKNKSITWRRKPHQQLNRKENCFSNRFMGKIYFIFFTVHANK